MTNIDSLSSGKPPVLDSISPVVVQKDSLTETKEKKVRKGLLGTDGRPPYVPKKAALRSVAIPGWGQIYNRSAWKIPIIYAGFGGLTYVAIDQHRSYKEFQWAYRVRTDEDETTVDTLFSPFIQDASIRSARDFHRRNRDLTYIGMGVWYALNVIEAFVDAHLKGFDVSEDLTIKPYPVMMGIRPRDGHARVVPGANITIMLK